MNKYLIFKEPFYRIEKETGESVLLCLANISYRVVDEDDEAYYIKSIHKEKFGIDKRYNEELFTIKEK